MGPALGVSSITSGALSGYTLPVISSTIFLVFFFFRIWDYPAFPSRDPNPKALLCSAQWEWECPSTFPCAQAGPQPSASTKPRFSPDIHHGPPPRALTVPQVSPTQAPIPTHPESQSRLRRMRSLIYPPTCSPFFSSTLQSTNRQVFIDQVSPVCLPLPQSESLTPLPVQRPTMQIFLHRRWLPPPVPTAPSSRTGPWTLPSASLAYFSCPCARRHPPPPIDRCGRQQSSFLIPKQSNTRTRHQGHTEYRYSVTGRRFQFMMVPMPCPEAARSCTRRVVFVFLGSLLVTLLRPRPAHGPNHPLGGTRGPNGLPPPMHPSDRCQPIARIAQSDYLDPGHRPKRTHPVPCLSHRTPMRVWSVSSSI